MVQCRVCQAGEPNNSRLFVQLGKPIPAVVRGDELVVVARAGRVVIEAVVTALEDGHEGESIRVRRGDGVDYDVLVTGTRRASVGKAKR